MTNAQITREDVAKAAADKGITIMEALRTMQAVCAKLGDEKTLSALCDIKSQIIFGDEFNAA